MRIRNCTTNVILLCLILVAGNAAAQEVPAPTAQQAIAAYTNELGSTLYIESVSPTGEITGNYVNRAAGYPCQGTPYPVTGWILRYSITFAVQWSNTSQDCNSVTGWTGYFSSDYITITTNWNLATSGSSQIMAGSDTFTRTAQTRVEALPIPN